MATENRGRSASPRPRPWSAADSDRCECVLEVKSDDVLLGRGSGPNDHVGNIKFRDLVHERKEEYLSTNHRQTKAMIAKDIVHQVYARGGRFLKKLGPVESAKKLPGLLARNVDDPENDRSNDIDSSGPCDVYQIQKHATVMEKAKQALRQNQRNGSLEPPDSRSPNNQSRRSSLGQNSVSSDHQPHGMMHNNNNWGGMQMGNMNIPTTLNNSQHNNQRHHGGGYQNNNMRDTFDHQNQNFNNSPSHGRSQEEMYQQQLYQQQQDLMNLQKQHDLLQQQMQYQQQRQQQNQFQSQQMEMETHNQLLQEQLELQIRQEQLRQLQQQHMQKFANSMAMYKNQQDGNNDQQQQYRGSDQNSPPAVLNGYATYTTTLDAIEDGRQNSTDGLADPNDPMMAHDANASLTSVGNISDPSKLHEKFDEKSMQMSTMMGSFKDLSMGAEHSMHGSGDTIGTIDNIPSSLAGLSMVHMSGISIMSMMNDSSDSLFKNPHKAGNDIGAKNASWGSTGSPSNATPNSSQAPLADVVESTNSAAIAAAAVLGKPIPGFEKAQRRWSGGFMPPTDISAVKRVNRRGSLQYTSNNQETNQMNTMATATAMLAMAHNQQLQHGQNFNHYNNNNSQGSIGYGGGQEMMNASNHGYDNQGDSNMAFENN
mmetsp:Transcript_17753/g.40978  ORF Transcript_17753/g.40978 Transcript_17753/m.40978 type:complete len:652 (+) Transcript_17753:243-2198(+)|eukprot:CAMPEP_0197188550 /NCGR_PEP_ID=MMETSP1423-20130617/17986_1 /TAXON_ID=476441 /ORGANISM="Pseudo-nitzschia heimii, Strain UNC1101" /LENGTH=651 /DNA_ID=CAMNT_0042640409 /DNA_START=189 /DNA_END=2144 /DNA_ORIENTATION=+